MATPDFEKTALSPRSSGPWPTAGAGTARSASANATTVGTHTALARFAGRRDLFRKSGGPPKQSRRAPAPGTEQGFSPRRISEHRPCRPLRRKLPLRCLSYAASRIHPMWTVHRQD